MVGGAGKRRSGGGGALGGEEEVGCRVLKAAQRGGAGARGEEGAFCTKRGRSDDYARWLDAMWVECGILKKIYGGGENGKASCGCIGPAAILNTSSLLLFREGRSALVGGAQRPALYCTTAFGQRFVAMLLRLDAVLHRSSHFLCRARKGCGCHTVHLAGNVAMDVEMEHYR